MTLPDYTPPDDQTSAPATRLSRTRLALVVVGTMALVALVVLHLTGVLGPG
jgi:hypothetical protein